MVIAPINMQINYDWQPLLDKFQYMESLLSKKSPSELKFNFGSSGCFVFLDDLTKTPRTTGVLHGKMIEQFLKDWIENFKNDLMPLKVGGLGIQKNTEDLLTHVDVIPGIDNHCKLNYIITDGNGITYVENDTAIEQYPTVKNTAWLIDTTKEHWVKNSQERYVFQIVFHNSFNEVLEHLKSCNLIYN